MFQIVLESRCKFRCMVLIGWYVKIQMCKYLPTPKYTRFCSYYHQYSVVQILVGVSFHRRSDKLKLPDCVELCALTFLS